MAADVLLVELWDKEERYKTITDNIGIAYLKASLDCHTNMTTVMLNSNRLYFNKSEITDPLTTIFEYITPFYLENPRLILGISCTQWRLPQLKKLVELIRIKHPRMAIIAGGYGPTFCPKDVLSFGVDVVCIGEGDLTILEIVDALREQKNLSNINGIAFTDNGSIRLTEPRKLVDVKSLPLLSLEYLNGRDLLETEYTYSHRGCCYRCDFCFIHRFYRIGEGTPWRPFSATQIHKEYHARCLANPHLKRIGQADDNFLVRARFLEELRELIQSDPVTKGLRIAFSAGACEINKHWDVIERCKNIISSIDFGYESRVPSFLNRQQKGAYDTKNMREENFQAILKLQNAKANFQEFDYEAYHILGDRNTTVEELQEIYPEEDIDKFEFVIKLLRNGPNVVAYFDERDKTYPLYMQAYIYFYAELCKFFPLFQWVMNSIRGRYRSELENLLQAAFLENQKLANLVYQRHGKQNGCYLDIDENLQSEIELKVDSLKGMLHANISSYILDLSRTFLIKTSPTELMSKTWFNGFSGRITDHFSHPDWISTPSYLLVFAKIFEEYEKNSTTILKLMDSDPETLKVYFGLFVSILESTINIQNNCSLPFDDAILSNTFKDVCSLFDEMNVFSKNKGLVFQENTYG